MSIFVGDTEITDIKHGGTEINSVYIGANKVWARILDAQTVTVGEYISPGNSNIREYGFTTGSHGSISDGTSNIFGGASYFQIGTFANISSGLGWIVLLIINGTHPNAGWTTMTIDGVDFNRADITFHSQSSGTTSWVWADDANDWGAPFGTTAGVTKQVIFT